MLKVLTVFGTRPEAIKMAPLIAELERHPGAIDNRNCLTGQHKDMVAPLIELFGIRVDYELDLMRENQTLEHITTSVLTGGRADPARRQVRPAAGAGRHHHLDGRGAGGVLRRREDRARRGGPAHLRQAPPLPRGSQPQDDRRGGGSVLRPQRTAKQNLLNEGIAESAIAVTGNTVIDALLDVSARPFELAGSPLEAIPFDTRRIVLVTAHRRESFGGPFESDLPRAWPSSRGVRRRHRAGLPGAPQPERARGGRQAPGRHPQRAADRPAGLPAAGATDEASLTWC